MNENNGFRFNLLPRKSKLEVELIEERDNSIFYATAIVLFAALVWLITTLIVNQIVTPRLAEVNANIKKINEQIAVYDEQRARFGELYLKSRELKPLLSKKVNPDAIFSVADSLIEDVGSAGIISYKREDTGEFVFNIATANFGTVKDIMENARALDNVSNIELRNSIYDATNNIVLNIIALKINDVRS